MKNTIQPPIKRKLTGPIDKNGKFHSAYWVNRTYQYQMQVVNIAHVCTGLHHTLLKPWSKAWLKPVSHQSYDLLAMQFSAGVRPSSRLQTKLCNLMWIFTKRMAAVRYSHDCLECCKMVVQICKTVTSVAVLQPCKLYW